MKKASPCVICSLPAQCRSLFFLLTLMFPLTVGGLLGQASKRCVEIRKLVVDAVSSVSKLSVGGGFAGNPAASQEGFGLTFCWAAIPVLRAVFVFLRAATCRDHQDLLLRLSL